MRNGDGDAPVPLAARIGPVPLAAQIASLPPVTADEYGSPAVVAALRRERNERRLRNRSRWWYLPSVLAILLCCTWGLLRLDQWVATRVIWPHAGARFVEVAPTLDQPRSLGGRLVVVIGGLNRKSGTDIALALLPGLGGVDTRLFSLVYGSEIAERDVVDKFDALVADVRPRIVDFYGSSMGGDIALILAAHSQVVRDRAEADATAAGFHIDGSRGVADPAAAGAGPLSMPLPLPTAERIRPRSDPLPNRRRTRRARASCRSRPAPACCPCLPS